MKKILASVMAFLVAAFALPAGVLSPRVANAYFESGAPILSVDFNAPFYGNWELYNNLTVANAQPFPYQYNRANGYIDTTNCADPGTNGMRYKPNHESLVLDPSANPYTVSYDFYSPDPDSNHGALYAGVRVSSTVFEIWGSAPGLWVSVDGGNKLRFGVNGFCSLENPIGGTNGYADYQMEIPANVNEDYQRISIADKGTEIVVAVAGTEVAKVIPGNNQVTFQNLLDDSLSETKAGATIPATGEICFANHLCAYQMDNISIEVPSLGISDYYDLSGSEILEQISASSAIPLADRFVGDGQAAILYSNEPLPESGYRADIKVESSGALDVNHIYFGVQMKENTPIWDANAAGVWFMPGYGTDGIAMIVNNWFVDTPLWDESATRVPVVEGSFITLRVPDENFTSMRPYRLDDDGEKITLSIWQNEAYVPAVEVAAQADKTTFTVLLDGAYLERVIGAQEGGVRETENLGTTFDSDRIVGEGDRLAVSSHHGGSYDDLEVLLLSEQDLLKTMTVAGSEVAQSEISGMGSESAPYTITKRVNEYEIADGVPMTFTMENAQGVYLNDGNEEILPDGMEVVFEPSKAPYLFKFAREDIEIYYQVSLNVIPNQQLFGLTAFSIEGAPLTIENGVLSQTFSKDLDLSNVKVDYTAAAEDVKLYIGETEAANHAKCNLAGVTELKLVHEATGGEIVYTLDLTLTSQKPRFASFYFKEYKGYDASIKDGKITVTLPYNAKSDSLTAIFTVDSENCKVTVDDVVQESGKTVHNFTTPVTYHLQMPNFAQNDYEVKVVFADKPDNVTPEKPSGSGSGSGSSSGSGTIKYPVATPEPVAPTVPEDSAFPDVDETYAWARPSILRLYKEKIITGYTDGSFGPAKQVTREEFVKMIVLAFDKKLSASNAGFTDVERGSWYEQYVNTAKNLGIVNGVSGTEFGVGSAITRQDLCVMIDRAMGGPQKGAAQGAGFTDEIAPYALDAVNRLHALGVVQGKTANTFEGASFATRAEVAVILDRAMSAMEGGSAK